VEPGQSSLCDQGPVGGLMSGIATAEVIFLGVVSGSIFGPALVARAQEGDLAADF
jgi:hypothetical protein